MPSVRFALEFNPDVASRAIACQQVERHMRLYLAATSGFETLHHFPVKISFG